MKNRANLDDEENLFAIELEKELEALRVTADFADDRPTSASHFDERVRRVRPVLDLLVEFQDQSDWLLAKSEWETEDGVEVATCRPSQDSWIPNLQRLGRFKIEREIGRGGNGIVLRATDQRLERTVALKIPRLAAALSSETKARFEREAKAAASLNHPGIVAIHEVGHQQGIDFIVSQFVEGINLARFRDEHPLTPRQSAACVAALADAMEHAHQRGVLHRDLKPSNVIVEQLHWAGKPELTDEFDLSRRCRIVDFGLAAIKSEVANDLTSTNSLIGTPAYMSPEQTLRRSEPLSPATDVYGLGVILYQMLTGKPPFEGDDLIQMVQMVRNQEPCSPQKLNRSTPDDVSAIAMKCLEKRPGDRYSCAAALRDDLKRFLDHEPVLAKPPSAARRIHKWIQRHPWAAALIGTLVFAVGITSYSAFRATAAETEARLSENQARVQAETAAEVSRFLEEMFEIPQILDQAQGKLRGKDVTAEQILHHAAGRIQGDLNSEPQVKARLMTIIGSSLTEIGSLEAAEKLLRNGLELGSAHLDNDDPNLAKSHQQLGKLLRKLDDPIEAEKHVRQAIAILDRDVAQNAKQLSNCYNDLGILLRSTDAAAARDAYEMARSLLEDFLPDEPVNWALSANIATLDYLSGRYDQAAIEYERALESAIQSHGAEHPKVAMLQGNTSKVYLKLGHYDKAKVYRLRDLAITEKELGPKHTETGVALLGLIPIYQQLGQLDAALDCGHRAIEIFRASLPPTHRYLGVALNNHASTLLRMRQIDQALQVALELEAFDRRRTGGVTDSQTLTNQILLAQLERMAGENESALERIESVIGHECSDQNKSLAVDARFVKALTLAQTGEKFLADAALHDALQLADAANVIARPDRAYLQAQFWALSNEPDQAIEKLQQAIDLGYRDARLLNDIDFTSLERFDPFLKIRSTLASSLEINRFEHRD